MDFGGQTSTEKFISILARKLISGGGYQATQNGTLIKREMHATHAVLFTDDPHSRISANAEPTPSVLYTVICVLENAGDAWDEVMRGYVKEDAERGVMSEYVIADPAKGTYHQVFGKRISDKSISHTIEDVLSGKTTVITRLPSRKKGAQTLSVLLVILNVIIFAVGWLMQYRTGVNLPEVMGIMDPVLIRNGEYWRLFTCMFLHADTVHLFGNMYFLYILTQYLKRSHGGFKYACEYFLSGLFGSFLGFMFSGARSLGASGAIMGLGGALVCEMLIQRKNGNYGVSSYMNIIIMIMFNLGYGLFVPGIDNWGHFGGFAMGFLIELITYLFSKKRRRA